MRLARVFGEQPDGRETDDDRHDRNRAPPVLPERTETVTALASGPEHTEQHKKRPERVADTAHGAILIGGRRASSVARRSPKRAIGTAFVLQNSARRATALATAQSSRLPLNGFAFSGGNGSLQPPSRPLVLARSRGHHARWSGARWLVRRLEHEDLELSRGAFGVPVEAFVSGIHELPEPLTFVPSDLGRAPDRRRPGAPDRPQPALGTAPAAPADQQRVWSGQSRAGQPARSSWE